MLHNEENMTYLTASGNVNLNHITVTKKKTNISFKFHPSILYLVIIQPNSV